MRDFFIIPHAKVCEDENSLLLRTGVRKLLSFLLIITAVCLVLFSSGDAFAQRYPSSEYTSIFDPVENDIAQQFIDFLFWKGDLSGISGGPSPSWLTQGAFITALGFYSYAILVIAGLLLFYHLITLVIQTAHSGKIMGSDPRQVWVPIRIVFAIGILVPVMGTDATSSGLNSGQYFVIKVAEMGSGLASRTWDVFLNKVLRPDENEINKQPTELTLPPMESLENWATGIYMNLACATAFNARLFKQAEQSNTPKQLEGLIPITELSSQQLSGGGGVRNVVNNLLGLFDKSGSIAAIEEAAANGTLAVVGADGRPLNQAAQETTSRIGDVLYGLSNPISFEEFKAATGSEVTIKSRTGMKYGFSTTSGIGGQDTCGAIILLDRPEELSDFDMAPEIYDVYVEATEKLYDKLKESARNILCYIEPKDALGGERGVAREGKSDKNKVDPFCKVSKDSDNDPIKATITFYEDIRKGLAGVAKRYQGDGEGKGKFKELKERLATELGPYGWVMAGAYVSTIERIQAEMGQSIKIDSVAIMDGKDALQQGSFDIGDIERKAAPGTTGKNNTRDSVSKLRQKVTTDQEVFRSDYRVRWTNIAQEGEEGAVPTAELQCLGMIHLNQGNHEGTMLNYKGIFGIAAHRTDNIIDAFLGAVDTIASHMKVWLPTHDTSCTKFLRTESGLRPFELGLDFTQNATALQNLITFGHNNVNAGLQLVLLGGLLQVFGAAAGAAAAAASLASGLWAALSPFIFALGMMGSWIGGILQFVSMFFFMVGFSFAYILPLIPFTRFFFAVLIWVGQVIEAVIAIPVVALAHLNPDGEGFIPQQAKRAYYFLFSIFLRPIMTLFGLIIGLLIFMISAYFLTFAYGIAVSAVGGTAYGHYVLAKIVYSLIYAFLLLVSANKAFEMITHLPANAVSWMGGDNAPAADLGRVEHMTEHEQVVGALAINEGVKGVQQGTQGVVGAINKKTETIKGKGKPQSDAEIES